MHVINIRYFLHSILSAYVYPSPEFERHPELESEAYVMDFKVTTPGIYEVTLWAYSGGCVSLNTKSFEVLEEDDSDEADPEVRAVPYILSFKVSPNPTDGLITVTAELRDNMPALLKIYEVASGRMVQSRSLDGDSHYTAQFDLSSESQGLYLVTISAKNDKNNVKIIVK